MKAVINCVDGCEICSQPGFHALGFGGQGNYPTRREIEVSLVKVERDGEQEYALIIEQPPNCQGSHREQLLFPFAAALDSDEQQEQGYQIIKRLE